MADRPPTFSESWHRVADQTIALRPGVRIRRHCFRGETWHVVQDPLNNRFFRLTPAARAFVARLRVGGGTVEEVWRRCLERDPENAPGQEEVIRLISQLYFANLLEYRTPRDSSQLYERQQRRRERETRAWWLNIMFMRLPLLDPDRMLNRLRPLIHALFNPWAALVWLLVVGWGLKGVVENFGQLRAQTEGVLAPGNLVWLYLAMALVKGLHEFGHAFACKRYGGEVHVIGVMLLVFTPVPYTDATSSWAFRSRWQRMLVGAAGMMVEMFLAALAVAVWAATGPGLVHSLAYNMIFVASVSTVVFNGNPLLRYDGYYMLSDWLEIPNLYQRALGQLRYLLERYAFGVTKAEAPSRSRGEAAWMSVYGVLSFVYRIVVFGGILLFVADRYLLLGVLMAVACAISWVVAPAAKFANYLAASPELERHRLRAAGVTLGVVLGLLAILQLVPFPHRFRAPGIVEAVEKSEVANRCAGQVAALLAAPGSLVQAGQPLVALTNRELELELAMVRARLEETECIRRLAMQTNPAYLKPIALRLQSVQRQQEKLQADQAELTVRAPQPGLWVAPEVQYYAGRWLPRGSPLGQVLDTNRLCFTATVPQRDVHRLFEGRLGGGTVRLRGQAATPLPVGSLRILPAGQHQLPSAALGWGSGGEMPTALDDPQGRRTPEPFFEVKADLPADPRVAALHGRSGKLRLSLPPEPLLEQWTRRLRQALQQRYQL